MFGNFNGRTRALPLVSAFLSLFLLVAPTAHASEKAGSDAHSVLRAASDELLMRLRTERDQLVGNQQALSKVVSETVAPLLDFPVISRLILGKRARSVTEQQRSRFEHEFNQMLLRTYTSPLLRYADDISIEYLPPQPGARADRSLVKTQMRYKGSRPIPIHYYFRLNKDRWQVYDIRIVGISAVVMFRNVFERDIERLGMDGFLDALAAQTERHF